MFAAGLELPACAGVVLLQDPVHSYKPPPRCPPPVARRLHDVSDGERSEDDQQRADNGDVCGGCHIDVISRPQPSPLCPRLGPGPAEMECHRPSTCSVLHRQRAANPASSSHESGRWQIGHRHRLRLQAAIQRGCEMSVPGKSCEKAPSLALEPRGQLVPIERCLSPHLHVRQALRHPAGERAVRHRLPVRAGQLAEEAAGGAAVDGAGAHGVIEISSIAAI